MQQVNRIFEKTLFILVIFFPVVFFLRSFILNSVILLISIIFIFVSINKNYNFLKFDYNKCLLLLLSFFFISQIFIDPETIKLLKTFFLLKFFLLFNAVIYVFTKIEINKLKKLTKILLFFVVFFIFDLFFQYILNFNILGFKPSVCNPECSRYSGLFGTELVSGGYISYIIISIFLLVNILYKKKIIILLPLIILFSVYITGERTALIVTTLFNIIYYSKFFKFKLINLLFPILAIFLFLTFSKEASKIRFINETIDIVQNDNKDLSFYESLKTTPWGLHYHASILMIAERPLLGNGYKAFRVECKNYEYLNTRKKNRHKVCSTHPHNFHLEIFVDKGLIGYFLFLIFIYLIFSNFFKNKKIRENKIVFVMFFYLIIILFLPRPTGSILSTFFGSMIWYFIGSILGYLNLISKLENKKTHVDK